MTVLTGAPMWIPLVVLVLAPTLMAMVGTLVVRRRFSLEKLAQNNEVAGFKFAVVGVLYAVLLAFAVIVVWERFSESEAEVASEAGAAATLYRLAKGVGGDEGAVLHLRLTAYLNAAIVSDWAAMAEGAGNPTATEALNALYDEVVGLEAQTPREGAILYELLYQLDQLTQARRARLDAATGFVPGILWVVLYVGGVVTVAFTFFFGTRNLLAQTTMTGLLAFLIGMALLVVVVIDHPFAGGFRVPPEALVAVLEDIGR